jgi:hypothetical protein
MAEKKKAEGPQADPDKHYVVKVKRPLRVGESVITPTTENRIKGKVLQDLPQDAIESYRAG